ncbi:alpha/beta fold hydrolase [Nocardioides sp. HM23]|uniref:acyl-CoA thioester hydrolase/BAAT C-terminal domain-containing protein n=1 Tax=Nocardioides bizhenqiangii TaxID=3095076 RepID=UPI002ACA39CF|nr:acyl-CoA thioester hydrolase/BAAT C-terminal domain-containing protein [Nocardioides sp. HM23]MDZ5621409.1 alpha/beta fold hydrolase [Nocardioides sp. HM23]
MRFTDPEWLLAEPQAPTGTGVLLLAGSSGRVDAGRAELLARHGATVLAIRWFGGPGQQPGPYEVPLELFVDALDQLEPECERLALVGTSFGAEAALLVAALDGRVTATVAFAPSAYVWPGYGADRWTSHWTWQGSALPFVPLVEDWTPDSDPPAYRGWYDESLAAAGPEVVDAAAIPVERIGGRVVLVAGGDDQVWPAVDFAAAIADRRQRHLLATEVVVDPGAGHRTLLPGEAPVVGGQRMQRGGADGADRALGARAWPVIASALALRASDGG